MSTENTQTDVTSSGVGAESASLSLGSETTTQDLSPAISSDSPTLEGMKQRSKEMDAGTYKPKSVEEAVKETLKPLTPAAAAYQANYKYKAALQEKEIEDFWRPLIKDADSEKRVKDALSKLDGFEFLKSSRDKAMQQFESLQGDYQSQAQVVQRVEAALERGDISSVFRQLGVKDEDVFRWTQQKLQMLELPPEQRKAFSEAESLKIQQEQMQEQMSQYQQMYEQQATQAREVQLDMVLSRPEIASAAQSWDSLSGQDGAFRDLVIQEARNVYFQTGQDLSAGQAAQLVIQKFGKVINQQAGGVSQAVPQAQALPSQTPQVQVPQHKPVIPNVNGKGASPIKKAPRSLDDLKRMQKEAEAAGR